MPRDFGWVLFSVDTSFAWQTKYRLEKSRELSVSHDPYQIHLLWGYEMDGKKEHETDLYPHTVNKRGFTLSTRLEVVFDRKNTLCTVHFFSILFFVVNIPILSQSISKYCRASSQETTTSIRTNDVDNLRPG